MLLSHTIARAIPSPQESLTSEFGMGSGVASLLKTPAKINCVFKIGIEIVLTDF